MNPISDSPLPFKPLQSRQLMRNSGPVPLSSALTSKSLYGINSGTIVRCGSQAVKAKSSSVSRHNGRQVCTPITHQVTSACAAMAKRECAGCPGQRIARDAGLVQLDVIPPQWDVDTTTEIRLHYLWQQLYKDSCRDSLVQFGVNTTTEIRPACCRRRLSWDSCRDSPGQEQDLQPIALC